VAISSRTSGSTAGEATPTTRGRLLSAAYELLVRDGYQATTVQLIARRAGLTTGAIYANFANKQELMALAVLDNWNHLQGRTLSQVVGESAEAAPSLADGLLAYMAQLLAEPAGPEHRALTEVTGAVLRESEPSPLLTSLWMLEQVIRTAVERAKDTGVIDPRHSTDALVALLRALYLGAITSKSWDMDQPDGRGVTEVLEAVIAGLAPAAGSDESESAPG
jgi:AcrR family transcriptional regulator